MAVIEVELDAFSGLPNPRWRLAPQDAETAAALFQGLGESTSQQALFDGLGYRGLRVRGLPGQADVVVWNEIVETRQGGKTLRWYDKDRAFERYLLGTAESQLNDSTARGVIETVVRQIDD